ncbi:8931_t:CDS:2 [Diversispora eburnea]|uniref:8931_t:CDS:1 n=1 Tax=Diversispora eburnea TaxID=1213867 RepID=A0A9N9GUB3_9GLOM|nr:8931_t:CDS:2 [Diversispora eburnea]
MLEWTDTQTRTLINERRNRNIEYHNLGRNRNAFWNSIANRINQEHNTSFNGGHCKEKFLNLVWGYNVMCEYMAGSRRARRNRLGAQYFDEFRTHFWERPEDDFDRIRNMNSSNRRRRGIEENHTPAPSIGEVEHVLSQISPGNQRSRRTSVDSRRSRRRSASPSHNTPLTRVDDNVNADAGGTINTDTVNTNPPSHVDATSAQQPPANVEES